MGKIECWKVGMEEKGLRVNMRKTNVMRCQVTTVQRENSGKDPCGICRKGVGGNSIVCSVCRKWIHRKCSGIKGMLPKDNSKFKCPACLQGVSVQASTKKEVTGKWRKAGVCGQILLSR